MARYSEDEIYKLRSRWNKPLLDPDQKIPIEVEGCKTFEELLKKGFNEIRNVMGSAGVWNPQADEKFVSILRALQMYGLEKFLEEGPPGLGHVQSRIVDLRGAYCVDAHFEGAFFLNAQFGGANCLYAHFERTSFDIANFKRADCTYAHFEGANFQNAQF